MSHQSTEVQRRTWCYIQPPNTYCIAGCSCGNEDTQWSEFVAHLWCAPCGVDFVPEHNGVFDGPIGIATAGLLGMCFDRIDLQTMERLKFPDYISLQSAHSLSAHT